MSSGNRFDESVKMSEMLAQDTGISNVGGSGQFESFALGSGADYIAPNSSKNKIDIGMGATANVNMLSTDHGTVSLAFDLADDSLSLAGAAVGGWENLVNRVVTNSSEQTDRLLEIVTDVKETDGEKSQDFFKFVIYSLLAGGALYALIVRG